MTLGRLLAILIVVAFGWWVATKSGLFLHREQASESSRPPIERAREVSRKSAERDALRQSVQSQADSAPSSDAVTENMTPDQVRALLGPPTETQTETTDTGLRREKWIYSSVGKTVVFENGIVVSVE